MRWFLFAVFVSNSCYKFVSPDQETILPCEAPGTLPAKELEGVSGL